MRKSFPYIAIMAAMLIWAGSGIAVKAALTAMPLLTLLVIRFTIGVSLMLIIGLLFRNNSVVGLVHIQRQDIPIFALAALFQPILYFILETLTYKAFDSPSIAEALLSLNPVIAPLFAAVLLHEHITRYHIVGIAVSTLGMVLLLTAGMDSFAIGNPMGIPLALSSVCTSALYCVLLRKIPARYTPLSIIFYVQTIGLLVFYPLWAIIDGPNLSQWWSNLDTSTLIPALEGVAYLGTLSTMVAFICFCYAVRRIGVTHANIFNNIRPVFTALIMLIAFHEHLPLLKWVGIGIVILGLFICQKSNSSIV